MARSNFPSQFKGLPPLKPPDHPFLGTLLPCLFSHCLFTAIIQGQACVEGRISRGGASYLKFYMLLPCLLPLNPFKTWFKFKLHDSVRILEVHITFRGSKSVICVCICLTHYQQPRQGFLLVLPILSPISSPSQFSRPWLWKNVCVCLCNSIFFVETNVLQHLSGVHTTSLFFAPIILHCGRYSHPRSDSAI